MIGREEHGHGAVEYMRGHGGGRPGCIGEVFGMRLRNGRSTTGDHPGVFGSPSVAVQPLKTTQQYRGRHLRKPERGASLADAN